MSINNKNDQDHLDLLYLAEQISNQNFSYLFDSLSEDNIKIPQELCYVIDTKAQTILSNPNCRVIGFKKIENSRSDIQLYLNHLGDNYILEMNEKRVSEFDWNIVDISENDKHLKDHFYPFDIRINILPRQNICVSAQNQYKLDYYITEFIRNNNSHYLAANVIFNCSLNENLKSVLFKTKFFKLYFFEKKDHQKVSFLLYLYFEKEHLYYECKANTNFSTISIYEMKKVNLFGYMKESCIFNHVEIEKYKSNFNQELNLIPSQNRYSLENKYINFFININADTRFFKDIVIDDHIIGTIDKYINAKLLRLDQKVIIIQINDKMIQFEKCDFYYHRDRNRSSYYLKLKESKTSNVIETDLKLSLEKKPEMIELQKDMTEINFINKYLNGIKKLRENILFIQNKTIKNTFDFDKIDIFINMLEQMNEADKIYIQINDFKLDHQNQCLEVFISNDEDMLQMKKWISESQDLKNYTQPILSKENMRPKKNLKLSFNRLDQQILYMDIKESSNQYQIGIVKGDILDFTTDSQIKKFNHMIRYLKQVQNLIKQNQFISLKNIGIFNLFRFISKTNIKSLNLTSEKIDWYDPNLKIKKSNLETQQHKAIRIALETPDIALIQGPPGSGKTTVIIEIIIQFFKKYKKIYNKKPKILIVAPTHVALDNVLKKIISSNAMNDFGILPIRFTSDTNKVDGDVKSYCYDDYYFQGKIKLLKEELDNIVKIKNKLEIINQEAEIEIKFFSNLIENIECQSDIDERKSIKIDQISLLNQLNLDTEIGLIQEINSHYKKIENNQIEKIKELEIFLKKIINEFESEKSEIQKVFQDHANLFFSTNMLGGMDRNMLDCIFFDLIIMDEAGKEEFRKSIYPMQYTSKMILVGDHLQLPPVISSQILNKFQNKKEVSISLFEKLYDIAQSSGRHIFLDTQRRMVTDIGNFISNQFYEEKLKTPSSRNSQKNEGIWILDTCNQVNDKYEKEKDKSFENHFESKMITLCLECMNECIQYPEIYECEKMKSIGVISPYLAQVNLLRRSSKDRDIFFTVDEVQGQEMDIVFFSATRSNKRNKWGFTLNKQRLNVAFSRAKSRLFIILDSSMVKKTNHMKDGIDILENLLKQARAQNRILDVTDQNFKEIFQNTLKRI